ncbi:MAG: hypothetical protein WBQ95_21305 [Terracidiphilus sp.]
MILPASEVESLKSTLNCWEWVGYISTGVVFLGCIGEFVAEFTRCVKSKRSKHKLSRLSLIVLIAGIAGELLSEVRVSQLSGELIANVEHEAEDAHKEAAQADLRRVQLENRIADIFGPRQLTAAQSAKIAGELTGLKGIKVDVFVYAVNGTSEDFQDSRNVAIEVMGILRQVGVNEAGWKLDSCLNPGNVANIVVGINGTDGSSGNAATDDKIASRLIEALTPEIGTFQEVNKYPSPAFLCQHPASDIDPQHPNKRKPDAAINIIVGRKVQPILTREMLEPTEEKKP